MYKKSFVFHLIRIMVLLLAGLVFPFSAASAEEPPVPFMIGEQETDQVKTEAAGETAESDTETASLSENGSAEQSDAAITETQPAKNPIERLFDGDYNSRVRFGEKETLTFDIPEDAAGLRFLWFETPSSAQIHWKSESGKELSSNEVTDLYETMLPVPEGAAIVEITAAEETMLSEVIPIDAYEVENYLYFTDPLTDGPIDAMIFCAHAGDEFLSFGSLLPVLSDQGRATLTVFMSHLNRAQLQEALDSARALRQPYEPIFLGHTCVLLQPDRYAKGKNIWDYTKTERELLTMIRQYKPRVVISHKPADPLEEGMRRYTANLILQAVTEAAIPRKQGNITKLYGAHTVSKLYFSGEPIPVKRGKYDKSTPTPAPLADIRIGSDIPLVNLYPGTNGDFTEKLYANYKTLRIYKFKPEEKLNLWISYTSVGGDTGANDLFEGIDPLLLSENKVTYAAPGTIADRASEATPEPTPVTTAEPTPSPAPTPFVTPEPVKEMNAAGAMMQFPDNTPENKYSNGEKRSTPGIALYAVGGIGGLITVFLLVFLGRKKKIALVFVALLPALISIALSVWLNTMDASETTVLAEANPEVMQEIESAEADEPDEIQPVSEENGQTEASDDRSTDEGPESYEDETAEFDPEENIEDKTTENPDDIYFRHADEAEEVIVFDDENGHWEYKSDTLSVLINKFSQPERPLVYYIAHIRMRDVDQFRPGFGNENLVGSAKTAPWKLARRARAVLAITGDNLVNTEQWLKGILIRNGQLYSERDHEPTMALMPDMTIKIYEIGTTAAEILDEGVQNTFGFGPVLVRNGKIAEEECSVHRVKSLNPRCGLGMVEPGHYVAIVCDGRQKGYSMGVTLLEYAQMFVDEGCTVAYNMDGGISSGMLFMGESIHQHHSSLSKKSSGQRPWADALLFGYSNLVPTDSDPIYNTGNLDEKKERPRDGQ